VADPAATFSFQSVKISSSSTIYMHRDQHPANITAPSTAPATGSKHKPAAAAATAEGTLLPSPLLLKQQPPASAAAPRMSSNSLPFGPALEQHQHRSATTTNSTDRVFNREQCLTVSLSFASGHSNTR